MSESERYKTKNSPSAEQGPPLMVDPAGPDQPSHIGRYRVERMLGEGGFGRVYLAHDDELHRPVAIKVPHPHRIARPEDAEAYLAEARMVASLDHPNIVPVHDVGRTPDGLCFVVSKMIAGSDLATLKRQAPLSAVASAELLATVALGLHYAHRKGLVHRDIKPANLLVDTEGKPYVADFGLALREEEFGKGAKLAGTPEYMSPEQARGEGHRVDGRSDIFSLGVVFYELLTGRRPFQGDSRQQILEQIATVEVRPPRQWDDTIPKELERICLKALAKRASERYTTAKDLADDLHHFLVEQAGNQPAGEDRKSVVPGSHSPGIAGTPTPTALVTPPTPASDSQPLTIVPKGLRSFDAHDADFFLELLPGPRDREGLPDSIRFWKTRIEETDADNTFAVGLIYGPSGCGKSSLVKAGLLPRLSAEVIAVYIEATADETETRLLNGLRKRCPALATNLGVRETLTVLRRGQGIPAGKKVLIVLDQFEQWLHARKEEENSELIQALRQCDGERLQCLLLVRDDFWMAVTRFMQTLEVRLLEGQNFAAVDLFDLRHARKVLAAFGRAFGMLGNAEPARLDATLQPLLSRLERLSETFREVREGVHKALRVAEVDPEMAVTRICKVLEFVVRDVYERRLEEPSSSRTLENLLQRLVEAGHFPKRLDAYAHTIRKLGDISTHGFGENVTGPDVHQSLTQLVPILDWYFDIERPDALGSAVGRPQPTSPAERPSEGSEEQKLFLEQAVCSLAQDGKVICVRLALFAEMVKAKSWTPATLSEMGGVEGVGVTFLEEMFSSRTASPERRYHQQAARAILKALLPESGTDIKGHMRSRRQLLEASGYACCPRNFGDLMRILDAELRLLTPIDPEGNEGPGKPESVDPRCAEACFYQLTHDYLVPSLRDWLSRKQKETREGRAELLLEDCANLWNARKEDRPLPTFEQWKEILGYTQRANWTERQRNMMENATAYHARYWWDRLLHANTAALPALVKEMKAYGDVLTNPFREAFHQLRANDDPRMQLHASLALLPVDATQVSSLYDRLLAAEPHEVPVIRDFLAPHKEALVERLWALLEKPDKGKETERLRAAAALATYDPQGQRWQRASGQVVADLVVENSIHLGVWSEAFRPVKAHLLAPLSAIFRDRQPERTAERTQATNLLADYAADNLAVLADLLLDADEKQFAVLYPKFKERGDEGLPLLLAEIDRRLPSDLPSADEQREKLAKRQANATVTLLQMNQPDKVWPLLKRSGQPDDPRIRSYLIHRLSSLGADMEPLLKRLDEERDVTIQRALVLSLGQFPGDAVADKDTLLGKFLTMYRGREDAGLHGAVEWLLRQWQQEVKLQAIVKQLKKEQEQKITRIRRYLADRDGLRSGSHAVNDARWYVNSEGQTLVVIPGPVTFLMGSPMTEAGREGGAEGEIEQQHQKIISRSYAIATKAVTVEEFQRFRHEHEYRKQYAPHPTCPVNAVTWYDAAAYCNWLSEREGLEPVYRKGPDGAYGPGMAVKANYLQMSGYRLPTEAEWEYACRAGALTSRHYGETEELLGNYAWYLKNSLDRWMLPVGTLKPNDLGLFDVVGNVLQWCEDRMVFYSAGADSADDLDVIGVNKDDPRALRGGSFFNPASYIRSAVRRGYVPTVRSNNVGFRPARTFTTE